MKYKWKVFLSIMAVVMIAYSICGSLMILSTFRSTFHKEVEFAKEEHEILQKTFAMIVAPLSQNSISGVIWQQVAQQLDVTSDRESLYYWIADEDSSLLYQSNGMRTAKMALYRENEKNVENGCYIYVTDRKYYLMTSSEMNTQDTRVYLNTVREITDIFVSRTEQMAIFYRIMAFVVVITGIISYVIAYHITKPLTILSDVARKIAEGDLSVRTNIFEAGEVGDLAVDIDDMAEKLEKNIADLNEAVRRQEDFVGNFAHELKTPLTSIIGYADMLRSRRLDADTTFESANYIFTEGKRLEGMSFKLLDLMVTKQNETQLKAVNAQYLQDEIRGALTPMLEKERIEFSVQLQNGYMMADLDLIKSVFFNMVDNARKALIQIAEPKIKIEGYPKENFYHIIISDNGKGIPNQEIEKITEAFYMVDKSRAREQGGAGLGLALCKQIMMIHQGEMEIDSVLGSGTRIILKLQGGASDEF